MDGIYAYFRHTKDKSVMVIMSQNKEDRNLDTNRFMENIQGYISMKNLLALHNKKRLRCKKTEPQADLFTNF